MEEWDDSYSYYHYQRPATGGYGWITGGLFVDFVISLGFLSVVSYFIYHYVVDNYQRYLLFQNTPARRQSPIKVKEDLHLKRQIVTDENALADLQRLRAEVKQKEDAILRQIAPKGYFYQGNSFYGYGNGSPNRNAATQALLQALNAPLDQAAPPLNPLPFSGGNAFGFQQARPMQTHSQGATQLFAPQQQTFNNPPANSPFAPSAFSVPTFSTNQGQQTFANNTATEGVFAQTTYQNLNRPPANNPFASKLSNQLPNGNDFQRQQASDPFGEGTRPTIMFAGRGDTGYEPAPHASPGGGAGRDGFIRRSGAHDRVDSPVFGRGFERPAQTNIQEAKGGCAMTFDMKSSGPSTRPLRPTLGSQQRVDPFAARQRTAAVPRGNTQRVSEIELRNHQSRGQFSNFDEVPVGGGGMHH